MFIAVFLVFTPFATYKILDMQTPFFIEGDPFSQDSVAQNVSLRSHRQQSNRQSNRLYYIDGNLGYLQ